MLWEYINVKTYGGTYTWEISPHLYFLAPGQSPHDPFTQLLIINNTGNNVLNTSSPIHSLFRVLLRQHKHERKNELFTSSAGVQNNLWGLGWWICKTKIEQELRKHLSRNNKLSDDILQNKKVYTSKHILIAWDIIQMPYWFI